MTSDQLLEKALYLAVPASITSSFKLVQRFYQSGPQFMDVTLSSPVCLRAVPRVTETVMTRNVETSPQFNCNNK